ncbi:MAG: hypothetical protein IPJ13_07925 [Saprospiraceae bacterium]|nr:hypothetical protein [Saprospiraceae bacterium]
MVFEDLRIDNADWRVFHIITKPNRWGRWDPFSGSISDFRLKILVLREAKKKKSLILGHDSLSSCHRHKFLKSNFWWKKYPGWMRYLLLTENTPEI